MFEVVRGVYGLRRHPSRQDVGPYEKGVEGFLFKYIYRNYEAEKIIKILLLFLFKTKMKQ